MPTITKNLLIINVLFFLGLAVADKYNVDLQGMLGLHFMLASDFKIYQFLTYQFVHANLMHLFFNMFAVWMFGRIMENVWGPVKFLIFYLVCGVGAGLTQEAVQFARYYMDHLNTYELVNLSGTILPVSEYLNFWTTVGASGAVYGILLAFGVTFPNEQMFIIPFPFPIKAKYFVMGYVAIEIFQGFGSTADGVAHFAHLGGMLFGWLLILYWRNNKKNPNGFDSWENYERKRTASERFKDFWDKFTNKFSNKKSFKGTFVKGEKWDDWRYNQIKKEKSEEIDAILDKVKKNGYDSLTTEEKRKLFESGKN